MFISQIAEEGKAVGLAADKAAGSAAGTVTLVADKAAVPVYPFLPSFS